MMCNQSSTFMFFNFQNLVYRFGFPSIIPKYIPTTNVTPEVLFLSKTLYLSYVRMIETYEGMAFIGTKKPRKQ